MDLENKKTTTTKVSGCSSIPQLLIILLVLLFSTTMVFAQFPTKQKPKLIRDTDIAEGNETTDSSAPKEQNPLLCDHSIQIGNFYFKKKNYAAAIERYLEALEYQPNSVKAYDALTKAYEKKGDQEKAAATYREFIKKFPESPKVKEFQARLAALEKKTK